MSYIKDATENAKKLPKPIWFAAVVLPMGLTAVVTYLAIKTYIEKKEKKEDEEQR